MPPKRAKVPLTPEEMEDKKAAKKAAAAAKKEAKRLAAEERIRFLKREHLRREVEHGELNTKRFRRMWREMVMHAKMPFIKEDLEVAWHTFDRVLDIKNYSISLLMDEVVAAEEQYRVNERGHIEAIGRLFEVYMMRLRNEETNYHTELNEMMSNALIETEKIATEQNDDEVFLQAMMFAMEQRIEDFLNNIKSGTISKVDELEDENKNLRHVARTLLEKKLDILWDDLCHVLATYLNDTEDRRKIYAVVKAKDDKARRIIARQLIRTAMLFEMIRKLKEKIAIYKAWADKRISEIMAEYDFFYAAYWTVLDEFKGLENFWRRTGAAQVMTTELRLERDKLKEEARCLRECLAHCIDKREMMPLVPTPRPTVNRKPAVVEASDFIKNYVDF